MAQIEWFFARNSISRNATRKTSGQTTITNHPIQLWVVFTRHMILLNGQIPLEIHQIGHAMGSNGGLKMHLSMVENFPFHVFKPLGWVFLVVILGIVHKVNYLTR